MTYASTITTDGPLAYFKLEETGVTSSTTPANSGSTGGTGTMTFGSSGAITTSTGAANIGGNSWHFNNNQAYGTKSLSPGNSDFTMEAWYKWDTAFGSHPSSSMTILNNNGIGHAIAFAIGATQNQVLVGNAGAGYAINQTITPNLTDGSWHHIAVVQSGGSLTLYVDGTSVATGAGAQTGTNTTTDFQFGGIGSNGSDCWLDEVAFYNKVLTGTQIANHYTVGTTVPSISITVTPPVMNMTNLTVPAPVLHIIPNDVTSVVPVMNMTGLTAVAPVVSTTRGITATPPAMALSLDMATAPVVNTYSKVTTNVTTEASAGQAPHFQTYYDTTPYFAKWPALDSSKGAVTAATVAISAEVKQGSAAGTWKVALITGTWTGYNAALISSTDFVTFAGNSSATQDADYVFTVDVTSLVQKWTTGTANNGLAIIAPDGTSNYVVVPKAITATNQAMTVTYQALPPAVVSVTAPAMTLSLASVTPAVTAGYGVTDTVPPMALSLDTAAPSVSETANRNVAAPVMTMALSAPGGMALTPDVVSQAGVMAVSLAMVTPSVVIPAIITVPAMSLSLATVPGNVDLTTNVFKVAPVMTMSMNMVGIFDAAHDRYLNRVITQLNPLDIWYKLDETSGSTVVDSSGANQNGTYHGVFTSVNDGPQLRKGVHFSGSSFLVMGTYGDTSQNTTDFSTTHALTVEFSIRTTQTDGVVFIGNGFVQHAQSANGPEINGNELRLEAGELVIADGTGKKVKVRKNIADGQWHHIVFAIPQFIDGGGIPVDPNQPAYVMVDGDHALVRYNTFLGGTTNYGGQWLPYTVMARATKLTGDLAPNGFLQGDLSNFIVRNNGYLTTDQAQSLYYEWSDANIISPTPMTLALEVEAPKVKGNVKKMLALYGLPFVLTHGAPAVGQNGESLYQYLDVLSGMVIQNLGGSINLTSTTGGRVWSAPKSFYVDDYFVVPVSIFGNLNNDNGYPLSTPGTVNPDSPVTVGGIFVNDETGHPRFIDLQNDLSVDVTEEYDVITAVNYPWEKPYDTSVGEYNYITPFHGFGNMTSEQWEQARDDLRDSILEAVYDGCSMWIGDYYMAYHLGFIQGYDIHDFDRFGRDNNTHAAQIDNAHLRVNSGATDYYSYPQSNFYRRITALVPGLTDLPGNDYADWVEGWNSDEWKPNGNFVAYDILRRPNGLQLGDRVSMQTLWMGSHYFGEDSGSTTSLSKPTSRTAVTSAHPDGICGTVVSREQDSYYGPNGVVVQNPYKDNALTIAAEVGTIVRGRPIAGRVFIELMGTDWGSAALAEDADKRVWQGDLQPGVTDNPNTWPSRWDCDSRRGKEIKITISSSLLGIGPDGSVTLSSKKVDFFQYQEGKFLFNAYLPMAYRGLVWLSNAPTIEAGDARGFASAMNLTITTPAVTLNKTSSPATQVTGAMRLGLDVRQPANYADGNVEVDLFGGMEMSLEMRGLGRTVTAPPMSLTVTTPNPLLKVAADTVTVYLDEGRNITLFLKEDN